MVVAEFIGFQKQITLMQSMRANVGSKIKKAMEAESFLLQNLIKDWYLNGGALKVRTGRLRNSITAKTTETEPGHFESIVGTNVVYGRCWEKGFQGVEHVRGFVRKVASRNTYAITKGAAIREHGPTQSKAKATILGYRLKRKLMAQGVAFVHPFDRTVNQKARPFLAPALAVLEPQIRAAITLAMLQAIGEK